MSIPRINPSHPNLASPTDRKASQIDASLRLATENAQPIRLRRLLQELRHTQPDAQKVTGALLLATQQKYTEKIKARKGTQSDDGSSGEEEEEDEDPEEESESDGSSDTGEIPELSSEEEEDDVNSVYHSDNMKRSESGSGEEHDGLEEEEASIPTSTRQRPVKSETQRNE